MRGMKEKNPEHCPSPACVVKVGGGRGFVIKRRHTIPAIAGPESTTFRLKHFVERRLVVTAAHCLPSLPPPFAMGSNHDLTYQLLGSLDGSKTGVRAECLFVNPVADIAVFGEPDGQTGYDQEAYDALTGDVPIIRIDKARSGPGWVLALDGHWVRTTIKVFSSIWGASLSIDPVEAGMSGSPILNDAGRAVGIVAMGTQTVSKNGVRKQERAGPQPMLARDFPGWLL